MENVYTSKQLANMSDRKLNELKKSVIGSLARIQYEADRHGFEGDIIRARAIREYYNRISEEHSRRVRLAKASKPKDKPMSRDTIRKMA